MEQNEYLINFLDKLSAETFPKGDTLGSFLWNNFDKDGYFLANGASRWCVGHETWDFVLKFDRNWHKPVYCRSEAYHYETAKEYRVTQVLLPIQLEIVVNGIEIYRQTKFQCDWTDLPINARRQMDKAYRNFMNEQTFHKIQRGFESTPANRWIARCTQLYGKKFMRSLEKWTTDFQINDLHNGNIGLFNNRPIILDYAGYHGSDWSNSKVFS